MLFVSMVVERKNPNFCIPPIHELPFGGLVIPYAVYPSASASQSAQEYREQIQDKWVPGGYTFLNKIKRGLSTHSFVTQIDWSKEEHFIDINRLSDYLEGKSPKSIMRARAALGIGEQVTSSEGRWRVGTIQLLQLAIASFALTERRVRR